MWLKFKIWVTRKLWKNTVVCINNDFDTTGQYHNITLIDSNMYIDKDKTLVIDGTLTVFGDGIITTKDNII